MRQKSEARTTSSSSSHSSSFACNAGGGGRFVYGDDDDDDDDDDDAKLPKKQVSLCTRKSQLPLLSQKSLKRILSGVRVSCPPHRVMGQLFFAGVSWTRLCQKSEQKLKFSTVRYGTVSPNPSARRRRLQFHIQFDPNFYVQFDLNYASNSTSILHPIRPQ